MRSNWTKGLVIAGALLLLAAPVAFGQTTGRIDGSVKDDQGGALPGVNVTVTSPSLQGERLQVTDGSGKFRFLALPPGTYDLRAQLEGFAIIENGGISVGLDKTVTLEIEMSSAFEDEVLVTTAAPVIDTTSTTGGANFSQEVFQDLPVSRTFQSIAFQAPGVVDGGLGGDNPSIGGASAAENRYVIDGLDTTDAAFGISATTVPFEFIQEVQVKTGGYEAEYGGALGGTLNVITKSGGNELQGDLFGYWSDDSLQATADPVPAFGKTLGYTEYDFGAAIGGKLIQDKLWYFVAVNPSKRDTDFTNRTNYASTRTTESDYYAGKLTWQVNPSHQVVVSGFGDPSDTNDGNSTRNAYGLMLRDDEFGASNFGVSYNGALSSSLFLELSAGSNENTSNSTPARDVARYELRTGGARDFFRANSDCGPMVDFEGAAIANTIHAAEGCLGGTFVQEDGDNGRDEIKGALTWFGSTGSIDHEIKFGANTRTVDYRDHAHYGGGAEGPQADETGFIFDDQNMAGERWLLFGSFGLLIEYDQNSNGETDEDAIYLQDRVRLGDYFSLNLGVRADQSHSTGDRSGRSGRLQELDFSFDDMIAPRVGFTWDVTRNGRSKLYGHYGVFYESVPLDINTRAFGNEQFNFYYFYYPSDGSLPKAGNYGTWFYSYIIGGGTAVAEGIKPMYTTETLVGFEYEVMADLAVGIKYVTRDINDVIEDISVDNAHTYFITNPGGTVSVNPVTGEVLDEPVNFPVPVRDYEAIELTLNKRFTNNWQLFASYVNAENKGNYGGLFRQDNGQLDPNITSLYDLPDLLVGADGLLPNDREHQFKAYGSYLTPFNLVVGFNFQYLSGTPISKLGAHPIYGRNERFVIPRGTNGRTPDTNQLDLSLQYPIKFGSGMELKLIADIFNVTDEQKASTVDQEWTTNRLLATTDPNECGGTAPNCPGANPQYGEPLSRQSPQTVRLGVKFSF